MTYPAPRSGLHATVATRSANMVLGLLGLFGCVTTFAAGPNSSSPDSAQVLVNSQSSALLAPLRQIQPSGQITLHVRQGHLLQLPRAAAKILVADPRVASFQVPSPSSVFVFAQAAGTTTLYALDARDQVIAAINVIAEHDLRGLSEQIARSVPGARVELEPSLNNRLIVRGQVRTPIEARQVIEQVQAYLDAANAAAGSGAGAAAGGGSNASNRSSVINQLKVELSSQINIQVRVVEVSRSLSHELGFDWGSTLSTGSGNIYFGSGNSSQFFDAGSMSSWVPSSASGGILGATTTRGRMSVGGLISALSSEGLATLLAEPNLTAMSGESAAFAAGGEVPVVIITNNNTTIDYKSYGVILRMTPTLLSPNRISLHIAPEVSELTEDGSVTLEGATIPALKVRRADTTVELASGQSFALAGMLRSEASQTISGVPGLRNIPWLGRLFEHEISNKEDTELVILVTANVVDPVGAGELQIPGQGLPFLERPQQAAIGYLY